MATRSKKVLTEITKALDTPKKPSAKKKTNVKRVKPAGAATVGQETPVGTAQEQLDRKLSAQYAPPVQQIFDKGADRMRSEFEKATKNGENVQPGFQTVFRDTCQFQTAVATDINGNPIQVTPENMLPNGDKFRVAGQVTDQAAADVRPNTALPARIFALALSGLSGMGEFTITQNDDRTVLRLIIGAHLTIEYAMPDDILAIKADFVSAGHICKFTGTYTGKSGGAVKCIRDSMTEQMHRVYSAHE